MIGHPAAGRTARPLPPQPESGTPRPVRIQRPGDPREIAGIAIDPDAGLIRAYAGGCWSADETRAYLDALARFVGHARAAYGCARVLLDRRDVSVQSPEVAALLAAANGRIFEGEDRIALVVTSSLAKMSLRQRMPHPGSKAFLSIEAAEVWLSAFGRLPVL